MKNEPVLISPPDMVEAQLHGLIAECHRIITGLVVPSAQATDDDTERRRYLASAVELVRIAAAAGDTVARLRGGGANEVRQRITVERIEKTGAPALAGR